MSHHLRSFHALGALLVAASAACASRTATLETQPPAQQAATVDTAVSSDADILGALHQSNLGEIAEANIAKDRSTDSAVKAFADLMIADHTRLDRAGTALAQQIGVTPTPPSATLTKLAQVEEDSLRTARLGATFDRVYMAKQAAAHQRMLDLVTVSIPKAQHAELRTALETQVRPAISAHLAKASEILGQP